MLVTKHALTITDCSKKHTKNSISALIERSDDPVSTHQIPNKRRLTCRQGFLERTVGRLWEATSETVKLFNSIKSRLFKVFLSQHCKRLRTIALLLARLAEVRAMQQSCLVGLNLVWLDVNGALRERMPNAYLAKAIFDPF